MLPRRSLLTTFLDFAVGVWSFFLSLFLSFGDLAMVWHAFFPCNLQQHDHDTPHETAEEPQRLAEATLAPPNTASGAIFTYLTYSLDLWV